MYRLSWTRIGILCLVMTLALSACGGAAPTSTPPPTATSAPSLTPSAVPLTARQIVQRALDTANEKCKNLGPNQICLGSPAAEATALKQGAKFSQPGDVLNLSDVSSFGTEPVDVQAGTYGVIKISASFNLPANQQATFLMAGDVTFESITPDLSTFTFQTQQSAQALDGVPLPLLMVQVPSGQKITFTANGAKITLGSTAIIDAQADGNMTVSVLEGSAAISSKGTELTAKSGAQVSVPLQGLTAKARPTEPKPIANDRLTDVVGAVNLLPTQVSMTEVSSNVNVVGTQVALTLTAIMPILTQAAQTLTAAANPPTKISQRQDTPVPPTLTPNPLTNQSAGDKTATPFPSLTPALTWTPSPTLPPNANNGAKLVYASNASGSFTIYTMGVDGSNPAQISNLPGESRNPVWSPDGTRIAFDNGSGTARRIYVMNTDGTGLTPITPADATASNPAWSPDGKQIAYELLQGSSRDIWISSTDGSGAKAFAADPAEDVEPSWSPDGKSIAFASRRAGDFQLFVAAVDGSAVTRLLRSTNEDRTPVYSPDGKQIAFVSVRSGKKQIFVINADGSSASPTRLTSSTANDESPAWSPDGTQVAFTTDRDGARAIYVYTIASSDLQRITRLEADSVDPAWRK